MRSSKRFAFAITFGESSDGHLKFHNYHQNEGIPEELIIVQLEALLRNLKNKYFNDYDKMPFKGGTFF